MGFFKNILEKQKQPKESKKIEKKHKEEYNITEQLQSNPQENRKVLGDIERDQVNDPGADELDGGIKEDRNQGYSSGDKPSEYVDVENVIDDESMENIELKAEEALEEFRKETLKSDDVYGFTDLLEKIYKTMNEDEKLSRKEKGRKIRKFVYQVSNFLNEYKEILDEGIDDDKKEYKKIWKAFKKNIGTVVYSSGEKVDVFPNKYIVVKDKKAPASAIPMKEEKRNRYKYKSNSNNKQAYKAYNPSTGKMEQV